jgi:hypothetical protein
MVILLQFISLGLYSVNLRNARELTLLCPLPLQPVDNGILSGRSKTRKSHSDYCCRVRLRLSKCMSGADTRCHGRPLLMFEYDQIQFDYVRIKKGKTNATVDV